MKPQVRGITIDDVSTRDIDDAIWVAKAEDEWIVHVSIADVAKAVLPGSEEDVRAHGMVATKYFARGNSPMLPRDLSEDTLSLWPNRPRRTLTVEVHLKDGDGEPTFTLYRSRLISRAKVAYRQIPDWVAPSFQPATHEAEVVNVVRLASALSLRLLERRRKNGAMALYDLNNGWITTEEGWLKRLEDHRDALGQILVQELMILANTCVARWAVGNDVPVPFRNHTARPAAPARAELLQQLDEAMQTPVVDIDVVRQRVHMLLDKASYSTALQGHYGLNLPAYVHFTSPIRRYADLIVHRQIRARLKGEELPYTREQVEAICVHIGDALRTEDAELRQIAKDKATDRARRVTSTRQLAGMYAKDFERVCKTWARSDDETPEQLVEAFRMRVAEHTLPPICAVVAFAEAPGVPAKLGDADPASDGNASAWGRIRQVVMDSFLNAPQDAVTVIASASQMGRWPLPEVRTEQSGPPHMPSFCTKAIWRVADGTVVEFLHHGPAGVTKKRIEQETSVLLLAAYVGLRPPSVPPPASAAPAVAKAKGFVFDKSKDPISVLFEYCQAERIEAARFEFEQQGPPHLPVITCTTHCAGKTASARAAAKQDAKRAAAVALIAQLAAEPGAPERADR